MKSDSLGVWVVVPVFLGGGLLLLALLGLADLVAGVGVKGILAFIGGCWVFFHTVGLICKYTK